MNSSRLLLTVTGAVCALGAASPAGARIPADDASQHVQVTVHAPKASHLEIDGGYLREGPDAVVRGLVRRAPAWSGPVSGHLHVSAYDRTGRLLASRPAVWSGSLSGRATGRAIYEVALGIPRATITRIDVTYAPGRHAGEEAPR